MSHISIPKRSISKAVVGLIFVSLLSPTNASYRRDAVAAFADLPVSTTTDHASTVLTSHRPWLAPVGHRQPLRADAPQSEAVSAWERQQQHANQEIDRKLIICHGC
jgi:hypothetical protein